MTEGVNKVWYVLTKTGGTWQLRSLIRQLFRGEVDGTDVNIGAKVFTLMKRVHDDNPSGEIGFVSMYDAIQRFYEGKSSDLDLYLQTTSEIERARRTLLTSSATYAMLDDDFEDEDRERKEDEDEKGSQPEDNPPNWHTTTKTVSYAVYAMVILFFVYYFKTTLPTEQKELLLRSASRNVKNYKVLGEECFDINNRGTGTGAGDIGQNGSGDRSNVRHDRRLTLPPKFKASEFKRDITAYFGVKDKRLRLEHDINREDDVNPPRDWIANDAILANAVYSKATGKAFEIYVDSARDDDLVFQASRWIEYILAKLNPVYSAVGQIQPLKVLFAKNFPIEPGKKEQFRWSGSYSPHYNAIMVRVHDYVDYGQIDFTPDHEIAKYLGTLVHEMSHFAHLNYAHSALDCYTSGICRHRTDPHYDNAHLLTTIRDAVHGVVFLGIPNDSFSYDQALVYLKMILDMRIRHLHAKATNMDEVSPISKKYWHFRETKGTSSHPWWCHREFWAHASHSYLYSQSNAFPNRAWIEENDPQLFELLEEVWSGAPAYKMPDWFNHW